MLIGNMIRSGTVSSNEDGCEALYLLGVVGVQSVAEVFERRSLEVQLRVHQHYEASLEDAGYVTTATDPIRSTVVVGSQ